MTDRQPSPNAQFSAFLSRFPPEIVTLVKRCMPKLRRAFPGANQIVYDYSHSLVVSFSMSERGYEAIVAIAIFPQWVKLYFDKSLPDPKGLLKGSGAKVRSVTVKAASDLDHGNIHALIKAAIKHSGVTFPRTGSNPMIIQSESEEAETEENRQASKGDVGGHACPTPRRSQPPRAFFWVFRDVRAIYANLWRLSLVNNEEHDLRRRVDLPHAVL